MDDRFGLMAGPADKDRIAWYGAREALDVGNVVHFPSIGEGGDGNFFRLSSVSLPLSIWNDHICRRCIATIEVQLIVHDATGVAGSLAIHQVANPGGRHPTCSLLKADARSE